MQDNSRKLTAHTTPWRSGSLSIEAKEKRTRHASGIFESGEAAAGETI
jgi:hypothetical protein